MDPIYGIIKKETSDSEKLCLDVDDDLIIEEETTTDNESFNK